MMKQFDLAQRKMALALFVVALLAAALLALVDQVTREPIAQAQREALHRNLTQVLPDHANDVLQDAFDFALSEQQQIRIFPAKDKAGTLVAYAWEQIAPDGYAGTIRILMGVRISGEIIAIRVTNHKETPGLGDGITKNSTWLSSFVDKTLTNTKWDVKKDGGFFDQFTGATITPRAVVKAVQQGLLMYKTNQNALLKASALHDKKKDEQTTGGKVS